MKITHKIILYKNNEIIRILPTRKKYVRHALVILTREFERHYHDNNGEYVQGLRVEVIDLRVGDGVNVFDFDSNAGKIVFSHVLEFKK